MLAGWSQPSAATAEDVVELGEREGPLVLWAFRDSGEDRLGNFWLSSYDPLAPLDGSVPLSPFAGWAYTYDATDLSQLCALLAADPARLVVTRDPAVESQLASSCQVPESRVDVQPADAQPTPP